MNTSDSYSKMTSRVYVIEANNGQSNSAIATSLNIKVTPQNYDAIAFKKAEAPGTDYGKITPIPGSPKWIRLSLVDDPKMGLIVAPVEW